MRPTFRRHDSTTHRVRFFFSLPVLVPARELSPIEEAAPPGEVDVDNKDELIRSAGTDMPQVSMAVESLGLELLLDGIGIGTDDDDDVEEEATAAAANDDCWLFELDVDEGDTVESGCVVDVSGSLLTSLISLVFTLLILLVVAIDS